MSATATRPPCLPQIAKNCTKGPSSCACNAAILWSNPSWSRPHMQICLISKPSLRTVQWSLPSATSTSPFLKSDSYFISYSLLIFWIVITATLVQNSLTLKIFQNETNALLNTSLNTSLCFYYVKYGKCR